MSLIGSAKMNGLDPHACRNDVLARLPTQPASRIAELLPHRRQPHRSRAAPGQPPGVGRTLTIRCPGPRLRAVCRRRSDQG